MSHWEFLRMLFVENFLSFLEHSFNVCINFGNIFIFLYLNKLNSLFIGVPISIFSLSVRILNSWNILWNISGISISFANNSESLEYFSSIYYNNFWKLICIFFENIITNITWMDEVPDNYFIFLTILRVTNFKNANWV